VLCRLIKLNILSFILFILFDITLKVKMSPMSPFKVLTDIKKKR